MPVPLSYPLGMALTPAPTPSLPRGIALLFGWRRVRTTLIATGLLSLLIGIGWKSGMGSAFIRVVALGLAAMITFGVFEQWPGRLPPWLARWALQVIGVAFVMPIGTWLIHVWSTAEGAPPFWKDPDRLSGFLMLSVLGVLVAPWVALAALVRQRELESQLAKLRTAAPAPLRWVRAQVGQTLRLISVDEIDYLRSDTKYTLVAWRGDGGRPAEALVRASLRELVAQLDPAQFAQVHRSVVVNLRAIGHVSRGDNETAEIRLKGRDEVLPVSRSYLHLFRQM